MAKRFVVRSCGIILLAAIIPLEAGEVFQSGPPKNKLIPGPFEPHAPQNLNGKRKGSHHCLVCEYDRGHVVLIFAREPAKDKDQGLTDLLKKLDKAVEDYPKADFHAFVVFLSPDASSSANDPKLADPAKLVAEAAARDKLIARLQPRVDSLKNVIACIYPAVGPKDYALNDKADVTALYYYKYKVLANAAFQEGEFQPKDAEAFLKTVTDTLDKEKKKTASKKK
jgi:hypothetical protein